MQVNITHIIRDSIFNNQVRRFQYLSIQNSLGVSRIKAKELFFAFLYRAQEDMLQQIAAAPDRLDIVNGVKQ